MSKRRFTTDKQREAARINGAKSRGPVTDAGKQTASANNRRHLLAANVITTLESDERFKALLDSYLEEFRPQTATERDLAEEMAAAKWRQLRAWAVESGVISVRLEDIRAIVARDPSRYTPLTATALGFIYDCGHEQALSSLNRYERASGRAWHRAYDKLRTLRETYPDAELPFEPDPDLCPAQSSTCGALEPEESRPEQAPGPKNPLAVGPQ